MGFWLVAVGFVFAFSVCARSQVAPIETAGVIQKEKSEQTDHDQTQEEAEARQQSGAKQHDDFTSKLNFAEQVMSSGQNDVALLRLKKLVGLKPNLAHVWHKLGLLQYEMRDFQNALISFKRAIQLSPHSATAHNNLAFTYFQLNRLEAAANSFHEALRLQPKLTESFSGLCLINGVAKKQELVLQFCHQATKSDPTASVPNYFLGQVHFNRGNYEKALQHFSEALRFEPHADVYYIAVGYTQFKLKRLQDALGSLTRAVELKASPEALTGIGVVYFSMKKRTKAKRAFQRALELDPDCPSAHLNLGLMCLSRGERSCALTHYNALQRLSPDLARRLFKQIHSDKVVDVRALEKSPFPR